MLLRHVFPFVSRSAVASVIFSPLTFRSSFESSILPFGFSGATISSKVLFMSKMGDNVVGDGLKPNVVFVLGAPGAGKGTQCSLIVKDFGYLHLSAGDLLRQERETKDSPYGDLILSHMKQGTIVPVEITCSLLENAMKKSGKTHFLIDGFPRNQDNLEGWDRQMGNKTNLQFILFLDCPKELCVQRCLSRGAVSGRPDDNMESLGKRFETYMKDTMPIIKFYEAKGLVRKASTISSPEEVHVQISNFFKAANEKQDAGGH